MAERVNYPGISIANVQAFTAAPTLVSDGVALSTLDSDGRIEEECILETVITATGAFTWRARMWLWSTTLTKWIAFGKAGALPGLLNDGVVVSGSDAFAYGEIVRNVGGYTRVYVQAETATGTALDVDLFLRQLGKIGV